MKKGHYLLALLGVLLVFPLPSLTHAAPLVRSLSFGAHGAEVSALQQFLKEHNCFSYPAPTGFFGPLTKSGVMSVQAANGLESVGVVGPRTRALMATTTVRSCGTGSVGAETVLPKVMYSGGGGGGHHVDQTAPVITITSPAAGYATSTVSLTASASDNVGVVGVQFRVDGSNVGSDITSAPFVYSWNTASVADGTHTITAIARDAAGNTTTSSAVVVTVDNTAPNVSFTGLPGGFNVITDTRWLSTLMPTFTGSATDANGISGGLRFYADGVYAGSTSGLTIPLTAGVHTVTLSATDAAGNTTIATLHTQVDVVAPTVSIPVIPPAGINPTTVPNATPTFFSTVAEANTLDHITFTVYDAAPPNNVLISTTTTSNFVGAYDFISSTLSDGVYIAEVTAVDKAGNTGTATYSFNFTVDAAGPDVTIPSGPTNPTSFVGTPPHFVANIDATGPSVTGTYVVYNAASPYTALAAPTSFSVSNGPNTITLGTSPPDGLYIFQVKTRDGAGNTGSAIHVFSYASSTP